MKTKSIIIAVLGFWLGAFLGNVATYLIGISGLAGWLLGFLPQSQTLVRLFFGILMAFVVIGLGGAVTGIFNGMAINRIDPGGDRRRYLIGAGYAYGVGQGILIIPILLLISLIGIYNDGTNSPPIGYILLFGLFGLVYGLIVGPIFSLLTMHYKRMWGVLLAIIFGYLLGGILLGLTLWWSESFSQWRVSLWVSLSLVFISLIVILPVGILTGLAYHRLAQRRLLLGDQALQPGRIQRGIVFGVSLVFLLGVIVFTQDAESFLTIRPAATATQLDLETIGTHWVLDKTQPMSALVDLTSSPDVSASSNHFVGIVWAQELSDESDIYYVVKDDSENDAGWSEAINVSNNPSLRSSNPQLVMDKNGQAHIIWEETDPAADTTQIFYSHCQEANCQSPIQLSSDTDLV